MQLTFGCREPSTRKKLRQISAGTTKLQFSQKKQALTAPVAGGEPSKTLDRPSIFDAEFMLNDTKRSHFEYISEQTALGQ
jgi:hypothetical protein